MSQKPTFARIGVVSEGTLRDEDLISAFAGELDYYVKRLKLGRDQRKRFAKLVRECNGAEIDDNGLAIISDNEPFDASELVSELQDALNEIAPPYCHFGTTEGDGACFGFWSSIEDSDLPRLTAGDPIPREHWGDDVLLVNDHGNVDCGHVDHRGRFKPYWSAV